MILLFTNEGEGSKISRTSSCNYRSTNDTSDDFMELCHALISNRAHIAEASKDIVPGFLQKKEEILFTENESLRVDKNQCFCPYDLNFMNYIHFLIRCKALLTSIESCDEMKFHLFMYQPIIFYLYFLDCVNDWLVLDFEKRSKENKGDLSVFDGLVRLSEIRKDFLKFGLNHELCDGHHRTQAMNIIMKECSLQKENKSLQRNLPVDLLQNICYNNHYIFDRCPNVSVMSRSDDRTVGFRDNLCIVNNDRIRDFITLKNLSEQKNSNSKKHQPTSFQSAIEELFDLAVDHIKTGTFHTYSTKKDEAKANEMILAHYGGRLDNYETVRDHFAPKFKNCEDPMSDPDFRLKANGFRIVFFDNYLYPALKIERNYLRSLFNKLIENAHLAKFFTQSFTKTHRALTVGEVYVTTNGKNTLTTVGKMMLEYEIINLFKNDYWKEITFNRQNRSNRIESNKYNKDEYKVPDVTKRLLNDTIYMESIKNDQDLVKKNRRCGRVVTQFSVMIVDLVAQLTDDKKALRAFQSYIRKNNFVSN